MPGPNSRSPSASRRTPAELQCVDHVRIGCPPDRLPAARRFYEDVIGLPPRHGSAGAAFGSSLRQLRLEARTDACADPNRRRCVVCVPDLAGLLQRLAEQSTRHWRVSGLSPNDARLCVADPAGHIIEVFQRHPL